MLAQPRTCTHDATTRQIIVDDGDETVAPKRRKYPVTITRQSALSTARAFFFSEYARRLKAEFTIRRPDR